MVVEGRAEGRRRRVVGSLVDDILAVLVVWCFGLYYGYLEVLVLTGPSSFVANEVNQACEVGGGGGDGGMRAAGTSEDGSFRGSGRKG